MKRLRLIAALLVLAEFGCAPVEEVAFSVETLLSPAADDSGEPNLSITADGSPLLSWLEHGAETTKLRFSELRDGTWQSPRTVAEGDDWLVNWADFPSVVPISNDLWAAHWLVQAPVAKFAYDVAISTSHDAGLTWSQPVQPHNDHTPTEHGFVSLFPQQSGVGAVWLDGRNMDSAAAEPGGMTLRTAVLSNDTSIVAGQVIDNLVCDCCQTDVAAVDGGVIIAYRNRTEDEIRDIYVTRLLDDAWQTPTRVADDGWEISGCPVNGPAIAALEANVVVAWYTAANKQAKVQVAWSTDNATSFAAPLKVDVGAVMGRVSLVMTDEQTAIVGWLRRGGHGGGEICVRRIQSDGVMGAIQIIARTDISRPSGFPQFALADGKLIVAHTDISGATPKVETLWVDLDAL
jgi:hypothetical protein